MTKFQSVNLTGNTVTLEPLQETHRTELKVAAQDESIWTFLPDISSKNFEHWFDKMLQGLQDQEEFPFVVRNKSDQKIIGTTRYYNIKINHKRLSIGYTWYISTARGTTVNPECKLLLLSHAFEALEINRVEFMTDSRNLHSRNALKKLGANEEGILRQHMILKNGYIRDSVVFSIIKPEWPRIKTQLQARL